MMQKIKKEVCTGLEFGTMLNVQFEGIGTAKTSIIGLERGRFLIIKPPALSGLEAKLFHKNKTTITYLHEGMIYGFRCTLIGLIKIPFPLLILSYPEASEELNLRKDKRVSCHLKGEITINGLAYRTTVLDSSLSGCRLTVPEYVDVDMSKLHLGAGVTLDVDLENESEGKVLLSAIVRNLQRGEQGLIVGAAFGGTTGQYDGPGMDKLKKYIVAA